MKIVAVSWKNPRLEPKRVAVVNGVGSGAREEKILTRPVDDDDDDETEEFEDCAETKSDRKIEIRKNRRK